MIFLKNTKQTLIVNLLAFSITFSFEFTNLKHESHFLTLTHYSTYLLNLFEHYCHLFFLSILPNLIQIEIGLCFVELSLAEFFIDAGFSNI